MLWSIAILPYGLQIGFVRVCLGYIATRQGLSLSEGGLIVGAHLLPQWLKWAWAPAVDSFFSARSWYLAAAAASAAALVALGAWPMSQSNLRPLLALTAAAGAVNTLVAMAVEVMMAANTPAHRRGTVGAWFEAGRLCGMGLGGALGLLLTDLSIPLVAGAALAAVVLGCAGILAVAPAFASLSDAVVRSRRPSSLREQWCDAAAMISTQRGRQAAALSVLPVGLGSALAVLSQAEAAAHWGINAAGVAWVQGAGACLAAVLGCFAGGRLCQIWSPVPAAIAVGSLMALGSATFACLPAASVTYVLGSLGYAAVAGMAFAAFSAVTLQAIGSQSAATRYSLLASLSNFPIWWTGLLLAHIADRWGAKSMLLADAVLGFAGVALFASIFKGQLRLD